MWLFDEKNPEANCQGRLRLTYKTHVGWISQRPSKINDRINGVPIFYPYFRDTFILWFVDFLEGNRKFQMWMFDEKNQEAHCQGRL